MRGFVDFVREQGVVGFAVGFILGGSISKVVTSLVNDVIDPVLSIVLGSVGNISESYFLVGASKVMWGSFLKAIVDFLVIAVVVYFGVKGLKLDKLDRKK
jgi:large conductance mechanosensitive channel